MHFSPMPSFQLLCLWLSSVRLAWEFWCKQGEETGCEGVGNLYLWYEFGWVQYAAAHLETLFTAFLTAVANFHRIFIACTVKVCLLKCVMACLFSTWRVKRASIFNLTFYLGNSVSSCILTLMELRDVFRSSRAFKLRGGSWIIGPPLFTILWVFVSIIHN